MVVIKLFLVVLLTSITSLGYASVADNYLTGNEFVIKDVTVIDGLGNAALQQQDIFIMDGKITQILPSGNTQPSNTATVIDGKGFTAMPGLIDIQSGAVSLQIHVSKSPPLCRTVDSQE